jgi:predicted MPP superfamily phosphohydrolase
MHVGALVLVIAIVGNVIFWMTLLGLVYRLAMSHRTWLILVTVGVAVAVVTSGLMLRQVGLRGPKLLRQDHWHRTPPAWRAAVIASAGVAAIWAAFIGTRRFRYRAPSLVRRRIEPVDIAAVLGHRPASPGLGAVVARLPGNEVFQLDVIDVEISLPRMCRELDGLSIVHLSDTHFNGTPGLAYFEHVCDAAQRLRPDMFALTGDVLDRPEMDAWLPTTLGRLRAPLGNYFVLGNHDVDAGASHVRDALTNAGWTSLGGSSNTLDVRGQRVLIAGTEAPWIGNHPQLPELSQETGYALRLLLSHTPYNLRWARRRGFDLMLAGHLHGGQILRRRHLAGVIERPPTVMHLSRGVGEMSPPFRWRCRPEITRLVLRSAGSNHGATEGTERGGEKR